MLTLKAWRTQRAEELAMDPGVLCPNSGLEAIAFAAPKAARELKELTELKGWFVREFGGEAVEAAQEGDTSTQAAAPKAPDQPPSQRSKERSAPTRCAS